MTPLPVHYSSISVGPVRLFALLVVLTWLAPAAAAQPRFAGEFAIAGVLCDCDPADFVFRTTRPLSGHADPDPASAVVRRVDAGRLIQANDWTEALTVVTEPVLAVALVDTLLTVQHFGNVRWVDDFGGGTDGSPLRVQRGDTLTYLTSVEGYAFFSRDGELFGGDFPFYENAFRLSREWPRDTVWFRLTPRGDRPAAWVELRFTPDAADRNVEILCETHTGCTGKE